jgi:hypothetical protein
MVGCALPVAPSLTLPRAKTRRGGDSNDALAANALLNQQGRNPEADVASCPLPRSRGRVREGATDTHSFVTAHYR